jgi:uncharacterized protein
LDITPAVAPGRQVIEAYGPSGFRVNGIVYPGAVIVLPEATVAWPVKALGEATIDNFAAVTALAGKEGAIEILLLGCGKRMLPVPPALRAALKQFGIVADAMATGAACRTYDVLLTEGRPVAAALLPTL